MLRAIAMMLINLLLRLRQTSGLCTSKGGLLEDLSSFKLSYLTPENNLFCHTLNGSNE